LVRGTPNEIQHYQQCIRVPRTHAKGYKLHAPAGFIHLAINAHILHQRIYIAQYIVGIVGSGIGHTVFQGIVVRYKAYPVAQVALLNFGYSFVFYFYLCYQRYLLCAAAVPAVRC
jgi:hypothetical protein